MTDLEFAIERERVWRQHTTKIWDGDYIDSATERPVQAARVRDAP